MTLRHWGLALLVVIGWGLNFVVIRFGLDELPPLWLGMLRFAALGLIAVVFIKPPKLPIKQMLAYGLTLSFGQFAFLFVAMYYGMPAGLASLVLQSQMLFTLLFARLFLNESWQPQQWLAVVVAIVGLTLLASQTADTQMTTIGFVLTIAAAMCWGVGNIVNRKIASSGNVDLISLVAWGGMIPIIPFAALSLIFEGPELIKESMAAATLNSVWVVLYLSVVASLFGYGVWAYLMRQYPASTVAPLTLLVPIFGLLSAWVLLGEQVNTVQMLGIAILMLGLLINTFGGKVIQRFKKRTLATDV
jgi:O-acetylserine/cysteine efflux transporter